MASSSYDFAGGSDGDAAGGPFTAGSHSISAGPIVLTGTGQGKNVSFTVRHSRDTTAFTANHEAYIKIVDTSLISANQLVVNVYLRTTSATGNGYIAQYHRTDGCFYICRSDAWTDINLGAAITGSMADGDTFGGSISDTTISLYKNGVLVDTRTDSTYSAAGYAQLLIYGSELATVDDWAAADIAASAPLLMGQVCT